MWKRDNERETEEEIDRKNGMIYDLNFDPEIIINLYLGLFAKHCDNQDK